jgi:menaquinone-dependent protoporphyrinogen IX oxidase
MKRALVLYHSLFGNTRAVALSLAAGIREVGVETDCLGIDEVDINQMQNYDLIAIGSPTHIIRPSKDMKEFLQRLRGLDLRGRAGFAFDTRNHSRMNSRKWLILENSAARSIEASMRRCKIRIIVPRESAIVEGREGPLDMGVKERFLEIGKELGRFLAPQIPRHSVSD